MENGKAESRCHRKVAAEAARKKRVMAADGALQQKLKRTCPNGSIRSGMPWGSST